MWWLKLPITGGRTGDLDPLPPGFNPLPPPKFPLPTPAPFFSYFFFFRYPHPKFKVFATAPCPSDPRPFFFKSPSTLPLTQHPPPPPPHTHTHTQSRVCESSLDLKMSVRYWNRPWSFELRDEQVKWEIISIQQLDEIYHMHVYNFQIILVFAVQVSDG